MAAEDLVRVRLENSEGVIETRMGRALAESAGVEILDEPVRQADGRYRGDTRKGGRPAKPKVSISSLPIEKKAVMPADDTKEKS